MEATPATKTAYALFLHRAELKRRKMHYARISATKIQLTGELITGVMRRMSTCSYEDLQILLREQQFQKLLEEKLRERAQQVKAMAKQKKKLKRLQ